MGDDSLENEELPIPAPNPVDQLLESYQLQPDLVVSLRGKVKDLPDEAKLVWLNGWKEARDRGTSEETAGNLAWRVLQDSGWENPTGAGWRLRKAQPLVGQFAQASLSVLAKLGDPEIVEVMDPPGYKVIWRPEGKTAEGAAPVSPYREHFVPVSDWGDKETAKAKAEDVAAQWRSQKTTWEQEEAARPTVPVTPMEPRKDPAAKTPAMSTKRSQIYDQLRNVLNKPGKADANELRELVKQLDQANKEIPEGESPNPQVIPYRDMRILRNLGVEVPQSMETFPTEEDLQELMTIKTPTPEELEQMKFMVKELGQAGRARLSDKDVKKLQALGIVVPTNLFKVNEGLGNPQDPEMMELEREDREEQDRLRHEQLDKYYNPNIKLMIRRMQELATQPKETLTTSDISEIGALTDRVLMLGERLSPEDLQALNEIGIQLPKRVEPEAKKLIEHLINGIEANHLLTVIEDSEVSPRIRQRSMDQLGRLMIRNPGIRRMLDEKVFEPRQRAIAEQKIQVWVNEELGRLEAATRALEESQGYLKEGIEEAEKQHDDKRTKALRTLYVQGARQIATINRMVQQYILHENLPTSTARGLFSGFVRPLTREQVRQYSPSGKLREGEWDKRFQSSVEEEGQTPEEIIRGLINSAKEVAHMPRTAKVEFNAKTGKWNVLHASLLQALAFDDQEKAKEVARSMDGGTDPAVTKQASTFQVTHPDWRQPVIVKTAAEAQAIVEQKLQDLGDTAEEAKPRAEEIMQKVAAEEEIKPTEGTPPVAPVVAPQGDKPQEVTASMDVKAGGVSQVHPGAPGKPLVSGLPKTDVSAGPGKHPQVPGVSATEAPAIAALAAGKSGEFSLKTDNHAKAFDAEVKKVQNAHGIIRETQKLLMSCSEEEMAIVEQKLAEAKEAIAAKPAVVAEPAK